MAAPVGSRPLIPSSSAFTKNEAYPVDAFVDDREPLPPLASLAAKYASERREPGAPVSEALERAIERDTQLAAAAKRARETLVWKVARRFGPFDQRYLDALLEIPRERFVLPEDIAESADDVPEPLDIEGHATVSAPHAYLLTFRLLGLTEGDHLLELGTGTGYGSALARHIVGPSGRVTSIEVDPALHARGARLLDADEHGEADRVTLLLGDGRQLAAQVLAGLYLDRSAPTKVAITYAISAPAVELEALLPEAGCLVAPVGAAPDQQDLLRSSKSDGQISRRAYGAVRYVLERKPIDA